MFIGGKCIKYNWNEEFITELFNCYLLGGGCICRCRRSVGPVEILNKLVVFASSPNCETTHGRTAKQAFLPLSVAFPRVENTDSP